MNKFLKKLHTPFWLSLVLLLTLVLRIPSFFEPYSYGDEMIYLTLGRAIRNHIPLYSQIHDNKPPLLYLLASLAGSLFWFKAILAIWNLLTIFIFWKLTEVLFPKNLKIQKVSTGIFALLTTLPLFEGNIVNAELFMIGPTLLAFFLLLSKKLDAKKLILAGSLFSISSLFKVPAIFDIPAIVFLWIISAKRFNNKSTIALAKNTLYLIVGLSIPVLLTFIWFSLQGAFKDYLAAAYLQNIGYLSSWRPSDSSKPFLVKNAPLILRALVVLVGLGVLYLKRNKLSREFIFTSGWLLLTLFAATLSERPYPHYLVQSLPPVSILFGMLFALKSSEQVFSIIPIALFFFVPYFFKFWRYPVIPYYIRFVKLISGRLDRQAYISSFGPHIPRNYKIADFIVSSTKPHERIFVWGDDAVVYALTRRLPPVKYVADYHIKDFSTPEYVISALEKNMPSFIVTMPNAAEFPELDRFIKSDYGLVEEIEEARIWKLLNPRVRSLIAN